VTIPAGSYEGRDAGPPVSKKEEFVISKQAVAQTVIPLSGHYNVFCQQILVQLKIRDVNC